MAAPFGIVFDADPRRPWLARRSARSLRHAGIADVVELCARDGTPEFTGPVLAVRAGAWLRRCGPVAAPPASATGRTLLAVGVPWSGAWSEAWRATLRETGGDFARRADLPAVACAWVIPGAAAPPAQAAAALADLVAGRTHLLGTHRVVRWPAADVEDDRERLRVVQVVTSLQQGGAERVTWDLHDCLPAHGVDSCLVTLGRPLRRELPALPRRFDVAHIDAAQRAAAVERVALRFGADVIHAHLVRGDDAARLARSGVPLVMTAHNTRAGWPEGLDRLTPGTAALLVACARAVERELTDARVPAPTRTAWNGIDVGAFASIPRSPDPQRLTLACVANPRPQKRLHLLPAVLAAVRAELSRRGDARDARLVIAGELPAWDGPTAASDCIDELNAEARRHGVASHVEWTNGTREVREVLAAADVFVSTSAHEGLSLAQLEALAAGVPVVAADVGGTADLARDNPAVTLVPPGAPPDVVAEAVLSAVASPRADVTASVPPAADAVRRDFSREKTAGRYAWLYRAVHGPLRGGTLWFVANNLCTGGAQSSLRRLAKALHAGGQAVRVAVLQEHADDPTPGRLDLLRAGVPVTVLPAAGTIEAADAVALLLAEMGADPPRSVTFWNAIQSYKLLLADALLRVPAYDVSPGEMFYDSMDAYFARPRSGLPYRTARDYGERLAGVIVKYAAEAPLARDRLGAPVHVIPNGVPLPAPASRPPRVRAAGSLQRPGESEVGSASDGPAKVSEVGSPPDGPGGAPLVIGTAARLHPHKRIEDLLDAFRLALPRMPAVVLRVAGGPDADCEDYVASLRRRAADLPVEWLGEISPADDFHRNLDVFAMISEPAGCPNASLEAMAAGLPIVATDFGGAGEQVVDGVNGRLVPPRDAGAFAEALVELAGCADCRTRMGAASRWRVEERFSIERMTAAYRAALL